ncbi:MAG: DUF1599 domain-containing protein, partial [Fimbriimonadaceae bacterium]|nr:DUF1599 domain-containing protein [Chitinophagales bacterium]
MVHTNTQYDETIAECRSIFQKKIKDYGTSWRILRPQSLTDQIFIKAQRIRTLEQASEKKVNENVDDEYRGIINYALIALIQLELGNDENYSMDEEKALSLYNKYIKKI